MPIAVLQDFKGGLDTRKSELTSVAGSLTELNNAHINQGGEVEKRKAFVRTEIPAGTFGLLGLPDGLYVFGSLDLALSFPVALPNGTNVNYQRLQHPQGSNMVAVECAAIFGGEAFVTALFENGKRLAFLGGVVVEDFLAGYIFDYLAGNNDAIAEAFAETVAAADGFTVDALDHNQLDISLPKTQELTLTATVTPETGSSGNVVLTQLAARVAPVSAVAAYALGRLIVNPEHAVTFYVAPASSAVDPHAGPWTAIVAAPVAPGSSLEETIIAYAAAINAYSGTSGYTAVPVGSQLVLYAPVADGATSNGRCIRIEGAAGAPTLSFDDFVVEVIGPGLTNFTLYINGVNMASWAGAANTAMDTIATHLAADLSAVAGWHAIAIGGRVYVGRRQANTYNPNWSVTAAVTPATGEYTFSNMATALSAMLSSGGATWSQSLTGVSCQMSTWVTAFAYGGVAPYSFVWGFLSGSTDIRAMNALDAQAQAWVRPDSSGQVSAVWRVYVTDAAGTQVTKDVTVWL